MADKQKTPTWLITVIATLFALIVVFLAWDLIHKMGDVNYSPNLTVENWFSFLVSLIGVFVTIFVGLQIYNSVESKRAMKDAEEKFEALKDKIEEDFNSMRKENLDQTKGNNDFKIQILENNKTLSKELDWSLKEIKKEYWKEITNLKETIEESKKTQLDIKTEMNDISAKWEGILSAQNDFREALFQSFLLFESIKEDDEWSVFLLLSSIYIHGNFSGNNELLNDILDKTIRSAEKINKPIVLKNSCLDLAHKTKDIPIDNEKGKKEIIQNKIYKLIYLINEIPDPPQPNTES